jgi:hypothetical protein
MQPQPYPGQETLALNDPVICTSCRVVVADVRDPDLLAKLAAHQCAEIERWCA